ncbi:MAG: hypothetical protein KF681_09040 [Bdellovibrionaceae bacterium]|nr:hypothetical protein [Pseudobdellovibrionaceae bacterium]
MTLNEARAIFEKTAGSYAGFWCVAGGWALDLFLDRQTREHDDMEIVVLRENTELLYQHFKPFGPRLIFSGEPPVFLPWEGDAIDPQVIQLRLKPELVDASGVNFDLLLTPSRERLWVCRRDQRLTRPLSDVRLDARGLPVLAPEIVLLFKAKYAREKDERDLEAVLPLLSPAARTWLHDALDFIHPGHPWIVRVGRPSPT